MGVKINGSWPAFPQGAEMNFQVILMTVRRQPLPTKHGSHMQGHWHCPPDAYTIKRNQQEFWGSVSLGLIPRL